MANPMSQPGQVWLTGQGETSTATMFLDISFPEESKATAPQPLVELLAEQGYIEFEAELPYSVWTTGSVAFVECEYGRKAMIGGVKDAANKSFLQHCIHSADVEEANKFGQRSTYIWYLRTASGEQYYSAPTKTCCIAT